MTVKEISGSRHFTGLSTDPRPTPSANKVTIGSTLFESDTGLRFEYTDSGWAVDPNSLNGSKISAENSSVVALIADAAFTGEAVDITNVAMITVSLKSDVASATDGLSIQQSIDGTDWDHIDQYTVPANTGKTYTINKIAKYFRIVYTNGSSPQTFFRMQIFLNFVNGLASSHRINDDITSEDDATLGIAVLKVPTNDDMTLKNVDVQNPFPADGDSVYAKDLDLVNSDIGTFSGNDLETLFNDYNVEIEDITATNPKTFTIRLRRPMTTAKLGIGSLSGDFSNVNIELKDLAGTVRGGIDDSGNNAKFTSAVYPFAPVTFIEIVIEFHTTDPVKISGLFIPKDVSTVSRIQGQKPDGTIVDFEATAGGNFKISVEEFDEAVDPVRKDLEGNGKVPVGITAVPLAFSDVTRHIIIRADKDNNDVIYIGKSDVTNAGVNALIYLDPGDVLKLDYDDIDFTIFAVSPTASQNVWQGALI